MKEVVSMCLGVISMEMGVEDDWTDVCGLTLPHQVMVQGKTGFGEESQEES